MWGDSGRVIISRTVYLTLESCPRSNCPAVIGLSMTSGKCTGMETHNGNVDQHYPLYFGCDGQKLKVKRVKVNSQSCGFDGGGYARKEQLDPHQHPTGRHLRSTCEQTTIASSKRVLRRAEDATYVVCYLNSRLGAVDDTRHGGGRC